ncbi:MAG: MFS transporter [Pseudolabrys sp.]
MTQATQTFHASTTSDAKLIGAVSAAHFVSHYYILLLPPLFAFVRTDYGVSYTQLGFALAAFNIVSAAVQTPAGFLVDRLGARILLIGGLLLGAAAFAIAAAVDSFWLLVAMFGFAGLANTVYHPADYAMLSHYVTPERIGKAYSIHTFAGMLGSAAAPGSLLLMQSYWGWRGAFLGASLLGVVAALPLLAVREERMASGETKRHSTASEAVGWRILLARPILLNLAFFVLLALTAGGLQNYSVVALGALYGTPPAAANAALTGYLLFSAIGVLAGGVLATHTGRHGTVAAAGLLMVAVLAALIAGVDLGNLLLILAMSIGGFFNGVIMPSRDMIVRAVTPRGSFGKVFGFVTTGFNIGGIVSPLMFGAMLDSGRPQWVFLLAAVLSFASIITVVGAKRRKA